MPPESESVAKPALKPLYPKEHWRRRTEAEMVVNWSCTEPFTPLHDNTCPNGSAGAAWVPLTFEVTGGIGNSHSDGEGLCDAHYAMLYGAPPPEPTIGDAHWETKPVPTSSGRVLKFVGDDTLEVRAEHFERARSDTTWYCKWSEGEGRILQGSGMLSAEGACAKRAMGEPYHMVRSDDVMRGKYPEFGYEKTAFSLCDKHFQEAFEPPRRRRAPAGMAGLTKTDFTYVNAEGWGCTVRHKAPGVGQCGARAIWRRIGWDTNKGAADGLCAEHWDSMPPGPNPPKAPKRMPYDWTTFTVAQGGYTCDLKAHRLTEDLELKHEAAAEWYNIVVFACTPCYVALGGPKPIMPKSQKARGLRTIGRSRVDGREWTTNKAARAAVLWPIDPEAKLPDFPFFARPCPTRPRHGFVDSRVVRSREEWERVKAETLAAEADAEIICMPFIDAGWSAIITPAGIALGPKNDGATSGHGSISIPAPARDSKTLLDQVSLDPAACNIKDTPYLELVCRSDGTKPELVQARDGPPAVMVDRYVPARIQVVEVVRAEGDLLEWEAKAATFKPGTVAWSPGGNMASHYAVHCVNNKVPILCTMEAPKVGEWLEEYKPTPMGQADYEALAAVALECRTNLPTVDTGENTLLINERLKVTVATLHSMATWDNSPHLVWLRGHAIGTLAALATAASIGETRHYGKKGPGRLGFEPLSLTVQGGVREDGYRQAYEFPLDRAGEWVARAKYDYDTDGWGGGFGGSAWANCAGMTIRLIQELGDFIAMPGPETWARAADAMNGVVNCAHNGGVFLNKFMPTERFDALSEAPALGFLNNAAADMLLLNPRTVPPYTDEVRAAGRTMATSCKLPEGTPENPKPVRQNIATPCGECINCKLCDCEEGPCYPKEYTEKVKAVVAKSKPALNPPAKDGKVKEHWLPLPEHEVANWTCSEFEHVCDGVCKYWLGPDQIQSGACQAALDAIPNAPEVNWCSGLVGKTKADAKPAEEPMSKAHWFCDAAYGCKAEPCHWKVMDETAGYCKFICDYHYNLLPESTKPVLAMYKYAPKTKAAYGNEGDLAFILEAGWKCNAFAGAGKTCGKQAYAVEKPHGGVAICEEHYDMLPDGEPVEAPVPEPPKPAVKKARKSFSVGKAEGPKPEPKPEADWPSGKFEAQVVAWGESKAMHFQVKCEDSDAANRPWGLSMSCMPDANGLLHSEILSLGHGPKVSLNGSGSSTRYHACEVVFDLDSDRVDVFFEGTSGPGYCIALAKMKRGD